MHEKLTIAETSNRESFLKHLDLHNQGKTNYLEMSTGLADSGIEKWTFDTNKMTIAYYDKVGNEILVEAILWDCNFDFWFLQVQEGNNGGGMPIRKSRIQSVLK